jgi:hypothetical protein
LFYTLGLSRSMPSEWVLNRPLDTFVRPGFKLGWTNGRAVTLLTDATEGDLVLARRNDRPLCDETRAFIAHTARIKGVSRGWFMSR